MRFLLDENLSPRYRHQLARENPELILRSVGKAGAPPRGTPDPDILVWCEENDYLLVTNNRRSMPKHLHDHLEAGRHIPGILAVRRRADIGEAIEHLLVIAGASHPNEYQDRIEYVPLK